MIPAYAVLTLAIVGGCTTVESGGNQGRTTTPTVAASAETSTSAPTVTSTETRTVTKSPPPPRADRTIVSPSDPTPLGPAVSCNYTDRRPIVRQGAAGTGVQQAQCYLNLSIQGLGIPVDGDFGPVTDAATRRFQRCAGIVVDGLIGAQTWSYLTYWASSSSWVC
jgi:peptidoglycan hydrolase-like protein with peptidoglycan-binding domain